MASIDVTARFEIKSWDEHPFDEAEGLAKLTKASVTKSYSGDIEATSVTEWLMAYEPGQTATFLGLERIKGRFGDRDGSLVLQHVGAYDGVAATADLTVVSGTEELETATGSGQFIADPEGSLTLSLRFD